MIGYIIVEESTPQLMVEEVNKQIALGYIPQGGVTYHQEMYTQAMTTQLNDEKVPVFEHKPNYNWKDISVVRVQRAMDFMDFRDDFKVTWSYNAVRQPTLNIDYERINDKSTTRDIHDYIYAKIMAREITVT